ncbi:hypothetical protein JCM10213v2_001222 [Rhodosporidiobolus nylandii]
MVRNRRNGQRRTRGTRDKTATVLEEDAIDDYAALRDVDARLARLERSLQARLEAAAVSRFSPPTFAYPLGSHCFSAFSSSTSSTPTSPSPAAVQPGRLFPHIALPDADNALDAVAPLHLPNIISGIDGRRAPSSPVLRAAELKICLRAEDDTEARLAGLLCSLKAGTEAASLYIGRWQLDKRLATSLAKDAALTRRVPRLRVGELAAGDGIQ